jgi:acyl carrier protein
MNAIQHKEMILESLRDIAPNAGVEWLKPNDNLCEKLEIDCRTHDEFLAGLSAKLGLAIPPEAYRHLNTLAEIMDYLSDAVPA